MRYEGDKYGNQYAARRCSMITRLTRNSIGMGSSPFLARVRVGIGSSNFDFYNMYVRYCNVYFDKKYLREIILYISIDNTVFKYYQF